MTSRERVLSGVALLVIGAVFLIADPVPQWPEYHEFADGRTMLGIRNAQNVLSNAGFVIVGAWGVLFLLGRAGTAAAGQLRGPYVVFFAGLILTAFGSGYYHLAPSNPTLIWDRLPMTIMFMGLFASIIGELVGPRTAIRLLLPLLTVGFASVIWWAVSESLGAGDLRAYGLVQFLPFALTMLMLFLYAAPPNYVAYILGLLGLYGVAKLCEAFDLEIYQSLGWISGHALKHLVSAGATACILVMLYRRRE